MSPQSNHVHMYTESDSIFLRRIGSCILVCVLVVTLKSSCTYNVVDSVYVVQFNYEGLTDQPAPAAFLSVPLPEKI